MAHVEEPVSTIDDGNVELLVCRSAKERLGNRGKVSRRLHACSFCRPPGGEIMCGADGAGDTLRSLVRYAGA
jgi:hypothetical protein